MPIFGVVRENVFADLKRKDHVIFNLNRQGNHPDSNVGYTFVNQVTHGVGITKFGSIGENDIGTIISEFDEDSQVWYHGIVNHCIQQGWYEGEGEDDDESVYYAMRQALHQIMEKYEDSLVRPMKSLWLGRGKMAKIGEEKGNIVKSLAAMANSGADLAIYYL